MLKEFNAAAEDRSGQIATALATTLGTIAVKIATGGVAPGAAPPPEAMRTITCKPEVEKAVKELAKHKSAVKDATAKLNTASAIFAQLSAAAAALGSRVEPAYQKRLIDAADAVQAAQVRLDGATDKLSETLSAISDAQTFRWPLAGSVDLQTPETGQAYQQVLIPGGPVAIKQWLHNPPAGQFFLTVLQLRQSPEANTVTPSKSADRPAGIRYRVPVRGKLILCVLPVPEDGLLHENPDAAPCPDNTKAAVVENTSDPLWEGPVPQLGQLHVLPYKNGLFQNNALSATFTEDGNLASISYDDKSSRLEAAVATAQAIATTAGSTVTSIKTSKTTRLKAQTDEINAETALLKARAEKKASEVALAPETDQAKRKAMLETDTDLLNAQTAKINAQLALQEARAALATRGGTE